MHTKIFFVHFEKKLHFFFLNSIHLLKLAILNHLKSFAAVHVL